MNGTAGSAKGSPSAGNIQGSLHLSGLMGSDGSEKRKKRKNRRRLLKLRTKLTLLKYWTSQARRGGAKRPFGRTGPKKLTKIHPR